MGEGPQPISSSSSSSQMIQMMFSNRPSFSGIPNGRETSLFKSSNRINHFLHASSHEDLICSGFVEVNFKWFQFA
jgi:hypothetical protein